MLTPDPLTPELEAKLKQALLDVFFKGASFRESDSKQQQDYLHDHVRGRYDTCRKWLIPWLQTVTDLPSTDVVEIGCGSGSTSAALALECRSVEAYDIQAQAVETARRRAEIMGLTNTRFHHFPPERLPAEVVSAHPPNSVGLVVCFAVLEHARHHERLDLLKMMWTMLKPGGLLVVGDTPNRLGYWDYHTTWLPFFDSLPHDLAIDYMARSPRSGHVTTIAEAKQKSKETAEEFLVRAGRGVSYHEFELALGDVGPLVAADGFDPEPLSYFGVPLETRVLYSYARHKGLDIHPAFLRTTIEVILRKPGGMDIFPQRPRDLDAIIRPFGQTTEWNIATGEGNQARLFVPTDLSDEMRVVPRAVSGSESWRVRLVARPRSLRAGNDCRISFRARADRPRSMTCTCKTSQPPWSNLGLHANVELTTEWQSITRTFRPNADCPSAVFAFELGGSDVAVEIADISIRQPDA
jgi:2-polyprenyl-3-methyl-5-hydroxy-6-metoxy-1,4-benzoquinol methylase